MIDYLLDENNDLQIVNGNFVKGDSTLQNQKLLLICEKGSFKQYPMSCVGLRTYLNDDSPAEMMREIRLQFSQDGMNVKTLSYDNGKLNINAPYGS